MARGQSYTRLLEERAARDSHESQPSKPYASQFGFGVAGYQYNEPGFMKQTGTLVGLHTTIKYTPFFRQGFAQFDGEYYVGKLRYDGTLVSPNGEKTPYSSDVDDYLYNLKASLGYGVPFDRSASRMEFTVGLGHWYLNSMARTAHAYEREQTYWFLPLAVTWMTPVAQQWKLAAVVEYDLFLAGKNRSHLDDADPRYPTVNLNQSGGNGSRLALRATKTSPQQSYVFELFHRSWKIDDSDKQRVTLGSQTGYVFEPANETSMTGISAGILF